MSRFICGILIRKFYFSFSDCFSIRCLKPDTYVLARLDVKLMSEMG